MPWWGWIVAVFAGFFLVNAIPHTMMGITGQAFPTALSGGPPNNSSAVTNVIYGMANIVIGLALLKLISAHKRKRAVKATIIVAGALFAVMLAYSFSMPMGDTA